MFRILESSVLAGFLYILSMSAYAVEYLAAENQVANFSTVKGMEYMAHLIKDRTNGRVDIKVVPAAKLGSEKDVIGKMKSGEIGFARVNVGALAQFVPEAAVVSMPFLFRNTKHEQKVLEGPIGAELLKEISKGDYIGLAFYESGFRSFYTTKRQIKSIEDMKGLRIRVQESDMMNAFVAALGAIPVPLAYSAVGDALKAGTIDGAENNVPSYVSTKHFETAKFYTLTNHIIAPDIVLVSRKVWETFSPEDQKIIAASAGQSVPYTRKLTEDQEQAGMKTAEAAGVIVSKMDLPLDRQPFLFAVRPLYKTFLATENLRKFEQQIRKTY